MEFIRKLPIPKEIKDYGNIDYRKVFDYAEQE